MATLQSTQGLPTTSIEQAYTNTPTVKIVILETEESTNDESENRDSNQVATEDVTEQRLEGSNRKRKHGADDSTATGVGATETTDIPDDAAEQQLEGSDRKRKRTAEDSTATAATDTERSTNHDDTGSVSRVEQNLEQPAEDTLSSQHQAQAGNNTHVFMLPRNLLVQQSEYFAALLKPQYTEGQTRELTLDTTQPWTFRVFAIWVLEGEIRYTLSDANEQLLHPEDATYDHPFDGKEDREDSTTWQWSILFALYHFGDAQPSRLFRQAIFEVCQMKLLQTQPDDYEPPSPDDIGALCEYIQISSKCKLRRYMVDMWSSYITNSGDVTDETLVAEYYNLPQEFNAQITIGAKRAQAASLCAICTGRDMSAAPCVAQNHDAADAVVPTERGWCYYHEHETEDERAACVARYQANECRFPQDYMVG